jgi:uncharacterized membrane protein YhaH (DUF805 family)
MAANSGRSGRMGYFWGMLYALIMSTGIVGLAIFADVARKDGAGLAWLVILIAFQSRPIIKRLHDLDRGGGQWWLIWLPVYNLYLGLILQFKRGTQGPNRFGPDPVPQPGEAQGTPRYPAVGMRAPRAERKVYDPLDNELLTDPVDVTVRTGSGPVGIRVNRWNAGKLQQGGFSAFPSFRNRINRKSARDYWIRPHDRDNYDLVNGMMWFPHLYHGFDTHTAGYDEMNGNWNDNAYGVSGEILDAPNDPIFEDGLSDEAYAESIAAEDDYGRLGDGDFESNDNSGYDDNSSSDDSSSYDDGGSFDDGGGWD